MTVLSDTNADSGSRASFSKWITGYTGLRSAWALNSCLRNAKSKDQSKMLLAGFDCTCLNLCTILTTFSIKLFLSAVYYHMNILNSSKHSPILIIEKSEIKCISIAVMVVAIRIQEGQRLA